MKRIIVVALITILGGLGLGLNAERDPLPSVLAATQDAEILRCIAFSPYVAGYDPESGPHPPSSLIDTLLDVVVDQLGFRCIMTYGVLNGLDYTFEAAQQRGVKVIAIIWLDTDESVNAQSIQLGIQKAQAYPETIVRISCGSEVRVRHGVAVAGPIIRNCINLFRSAGGTQPIGTIETWWGWCNEEWPCQQWNLADDVDWIGINVFPWWENKYSGLFTCTPTAEAADFHIARIQDVMALYPQKEIILTEFGWPAGPDGYSETNQYTEQRCGIASEANQHLVIEETLARLDRLGLPGIVFEAFREEWKQHHEGPAGPFWGVCEGTSPYTCKFPYGLRQRLYLPLVLR